MTRADALRALIERVEAGETNTLTLDRLIIRAGGEAEWDVRCALGGSLNAVARLEAPLRERGWIGPFIAPPVHEGSRWHVEWVAPGRWETDGGGPDAFAPDEAPARLLAVLRVLLWEAEHG